MKTTVITLISLLTLNLFNVQTIKAEEISSRFGSDNKLYYKVYANAVPSGVIEWRYLGRKEMGGRTVEALTIDSDTKIMKFLNLQSKEKVFLDAQTFLPVKVERDIVFFGKNELITEVYDQIKGTVTVTNIQNDIKKEEVFTPGSPVHNILSLLYFFPPDVVLEKGKWVTFKLPTQKVQIKLHSYRNITLPDKEVRPAVLLIGKGAKRFNLWLDKETRVPLRLEFITLLGKVTIVKQSNR